MQEFLPLELTVLQRKRLRSYMKMHGTVRYGYSRIAGNRNGSIVVQLQNTSRKK